MSVKKESKLKLKYLQLRFTKMIQTKSLTSEKYKRMKSMEEKHQILQFILILKS